MRKLNAFFDGACEPHNPGGHMGMGWFVVDTETGEMLKEWSSYIAAKKGNTNNVAEYTALLELLKWLYRNHKSDDITIKGDSMLAINQMNGKYRIRKGAYIDIARRCVEAKNHFAKIAFEHVRREKNEHADMLSKHELKKRNIPVTIRKK